MYKFAFQVLFSFFLLASVAITFFHNQRWKEIAMYVRVQVACILSTNTQKGGKERGGL